MHPVTLIHLYLIHVRLLAEQAVYHGQVLFLDSLVRFATLLVVQTAARVLRNGAISTGLTS